MTNDVLCLVLTDFFWFHVKVKFRVIYLGCTRILQQIPVSYKSLILIPLKKECTDILQNNLPFSLKRVKAAIDLLVELESFSNAGTLKRRRCCISRERTGNMQAVSI